MSYDTEELRTLRDGLLLADDAIKALRAVVEDQEQRLKILEDRLKD